ncbi:PLP-dependent aspartate aminotransferase family protein [Myxococcota bacterium]|nr:PLP-dependent aspartate aminotransferase family protein [Myxococcota bacterium]MBU1898773.1 PLP-dependent aspartate aminotransferase family protein [Myxococcota bacterium]
MRNFKDLDPRTIAIHAGQHPDPASGACSAPIIQASTFAFDNCAQGAARFAGEAEGFIYTRMGNPTIARLEDAVCALEGGVGALSTASGMGAVSTALFGLLKAGDHVVGHESLYGPSRMIVERDFARFGVTSTFIDTTDLAAAAAAMQPNTRVVMLESPANPTMGISDIKALAELAHAHDALLLVDNTFATPINQNPLAMGADVVIHSMTKFINGHTDVVAGMIVFGDEALRAPLTRAHHYLGANMDPHQAWLVLRGIKTLAMRVKEAEANAMQIAAYLEDHPKVKWVRYPGLESHPQYALGRAQQRGPGSLMSFEVEGGLEGGRQLLDHLELMTLAVSLGGIETLIQHPGSMTHAAIPADERVAAGITDGLVRLSVGCEAVADLIADLERAFKHV